MAAATTYPSRINLTLDSIEYYSYDPWGRDGTATQIQILAQPPFVESYSNIELILSDIKYQAKYGYNVTAYVSVDARSCVASSTDFLNTQSQGGNCTEICADDATMFLPFNLDTCISLSAVSLLVQNDTVNFVETGFVSELESELGYLTEWDGSGILERAMLCVVDACMQYNLSSCPESTQNIFDTYSDITAENVEAILEDLKGICDNVGLQVNSDIAGPGVMVSYLLQISAALFFWVLVKILTSWPRLIAWPFYLILFVAQKNRKRPTVPGFDPNLSPAPYDKEPALPGRRRSAWMRANDIQNRLIEWRLHAATVSTLVEFQEVQVFFVGAIQVATLATFRPKGLSQSSDANSARSFGEAILDSELVTFLAVNGLIPLLFVQCLLQRYGMRWWYTFALLWVTFVLALVVMARENSLISSYDTLWEVFMKNSPVALCGGNANPMVYCDTTGQYWQNTNAGVTMIYVAMPFLTVDFLAPTMQTLRPFKAALSYLRMLEDQSRMYAWVRNKFWPRFLRFVWFALECVLVLFMCSYFTALVEMAALMNEGANSWGSWSFGQLIAVMVWVPLLFKFVYYNIL